MSAKLYSWKSSLRRILICIGLFYLFVCASMFGIQRSLLYFPTHEPAEGRLSPWGDEGKLLGYWNQTDQPETVWLMMHGNGGQASDRDYVLQRLSPADALYVLEYPAMERERVSPARLRSMRLRWMPMIAWLSSIRIRRSV